MISILQASAAVIPRNYVNAVRAVVSEHSVRGIKEEEVMSPSPRETDGRLFQSVYSTAVSIFGPRGVGQDRGRTKPVAWPVLSIRVGDLFRESRARRSIGRTTDAAQLPLASVVEAGGRFRGLRFSLFPGNSKWFTRGVSPALRV